MEEEFTGLLSKMEVGESGQYRVQYSSIHDFEPWIIKSFIPARLHRCWDWTKKYSPEDWIDYEVTETSGETSVMIRNKQ